MTINESDNTIEQERQGTEKQQKHIILKNKVAVRNATVAKMFYAQ